MLQDTRDKDEHGWDCDGVCGRSWRCCDGMIKCRYCDRDFCRGCHELLLGDKLPKKICGKGHAFLRVPYLSPEQAFKEGEILVDGGAIRMEQWKKNVKKQYSL